MIDCFLRTTSRKNEIRLPFFYAVRHRWRMEANVIELKDLGIREGRMKAEQMASSDPYIFTDDDVLIVGKDWIKRGTEAMLAHLEYAICSTLSLVEGENLAAPGYISGDASEEDMEIYPMHAVGAPMWIRKGILKEDLPDLTLDQECGIIHKYVLEKGYKEGLINGLRHNHLGHGFSSNPALHWGY